MKYLLRFCSLLLCVCICLGLFSVSAYATEDSSSLDYVVTTSWWADGLEKTEFTDTIISDIEHQKINIGVTVTFAEPSEVGVVHPIDLVISLNIGGGSVQVQHSDLIGIDGSVIYSPLAFYDSSDKTITVPDLSSNVKASSVYVELSVTNPVFNISSYMTIDGVRYTLDSSTSNWEEWVNSEYNTGGFKVDGEYISNADGTKKVSMLRSDGFYALVTKTEQIQHSAYILEEVTVTPSIILKNLIWQINYTYDTSKSFDVSLTDAYIYQYNYPLTRVTLNNGTLTVYYKTSSNGVITTKQVGSNGTRSNAPYCKWFFETNPTDETFLNFVYNNSIVMGGGADDGGIEDGPSASYSLRSTPSWIEFQFDFSVTSVVVHAQTSEEIQGGIFSWVKKIFKGITELPTNIGNAIRGFFIELGEKILALGDYLLNGVKSLFVPTEQDITDVKGQFEQLLSTRFGAVYESTSIIDDFATAFSNASNTQEQEYVSFPSTTVNLAGTDFTFGGWQVDVVPDGFEFLVNTLKMITSIACTFLFVNAMRKRLEDIFKK